MGRVVIMSCYFSPNRPLQEFSDYLQDLENALTTIAGPGDQILIGGDYNAKATLWGAPRNDARGNMLIDFVNVNDLVVANQGHTLTFNDTRGGSSFIDVTFT